MQFQGESSWDAVVRSNSLDIKEEEAFWEFVVSTGYTKNAPMETLELLFAEWQQTPSSH